MAPLDENTVGGRIRLARRVSSLTVEKLAELAGVSKSHIGAVERGAKKPSENLLRKIADATGSDAKWLIHGNKGRRAHNADTCQETIGARIRQARIEANMSMKELAGLADISHFYLGILERGDKGKKPSSTVLVKIADATGFNIEWLLTGRGESLKHSRRPTQAQTRQEAFWTSQEERNDHLWARCSNCGFQAENYKCVKIGTSSDDYIGVKWPFCPKCGRHMRHMGINQKQKPKAQGNSMQKQEVR